MRELESIFWRIVQGLIKFDVFLKGFVTDFANFWDMGIFGVNTEWQN